MSKELRPNMNCVGLTVDILESIDKHKRGNAAQTNLTVILRLLRTDIVDFVDKVDGALNQYFGVSK